MILDDHASITLTIMMFARKSSDTKNIFQTFSAAKESEIEDRA